jgi:putative protease
MILSKKIPELCVPAGNLNIFKYAVNYGADAVYIGGNKFNLRSSGDNFTVDEQAEAVDYAHARDRKVYLTLNAIIDEGELEELADYLKIIKSINFDALIISDPAAFQLIREFMPNKRTHISTQVSTSNHHSVNFWAELGAERVNVSREIPYSELLALVEKSNIEVEVFIHGALCISYSGRCMLSKYLSCRDANKGECSHTCRWKYYLMEEQRPNMYFPVVQDKRGTFIYNSRDLCLLSKLDLIVESGVSAIKIEGRMKTENYVGLTTSIYRQALDLIKAGNFTDQKKIYLLNELDKTNHRNFTEGFMFLENAINAPELIDNENVGYIRKYRFAGVVEGFSKGKNGSVIRAKNQFKNGEVLDIYQPGKNPKKIRLKNVIDYNTGEAVDVINTNDLVIIPGIGKLDDFSLIRVKA